MDEVKLSVELVNAILSYLGRKPYIETAQLIQAIVAAVPKEQQAKVDVSDVDVKTEVDDEVQD